MTPTTEGVSAIATPFSAPRIAELLAGPGGDARVPTPEQQLVIEHPIGGSALVVAGAGSGKTETMANRVVWLVANGLVPPDGVLGLTFTRKAASELAERVRLRLITFAEELEAARIRGVLSADEAARAPALIELLADGLDLPQVSTYNAFASGIVQEFGASAGVAADAVLLDEASAWRLAREVVRTSRDTALPESELSLGRLTELVLQLDRSVHEHLSSFGRVDLVGEEFARVLTLPYNEAEAKKGQPSGKQYVDIVKAVDAIGGTALISRLAASYAAEKQRRGWLEFSDQVALALDVVERSPQAAAAIRRRSPVVLLDEVQDTSVGQTRLLAKLFAGETVMAVGDPHQSIYGWRGASSENLPQFHRDFRGQAGPDGDQAQDPVTLSLSTSWRNAARVLDAANVVAGPLAADSPITVPVLAPRPAAPVGSIEVRYPETVHDERAELARWMRDARDEHLARTGELPTAAILMRNRRPMAAFSAALTELGVPNQIVGLGGLLTTPEITDVVAALRCIWSADAGGPLIRLLAGPRFRIGVADLSGLRDTVRWFSRRDASQQQLSEEDLAPDGVLPDPDRRTTLLDALDEIPRLPDDHTAMRSISEVGRARLRDAGTMLAELRRGVGAGLPDLVRQVEHALRLDIELEANEHAAHAGSATARANLEAFHELIEGFVANDESGSLPALLAWLDRAIGDDAHAEHVPEPEPGTVQLITVHSSKGLEWDLVAIPRLVAGEFPSKPREGTGWLRVGQLPDELRGDAAARPALNWRIAATQQELKNDIAAYKAELAERHAADERRLAYVALTRARDRLLLTGSYWGGQKGQRGPSIVLSELGEAGIIEAIPEASEHAEDPSERAELTLQWPLDPLGRRRGLVLAAAERVRAAIDGVDAGDQDPVGDRADGADFAVPLDPTVRLLLAERDADAAAVSRPARTELQPGERINASMFHEIIADPVAAERRRLRPMPQRPFRQTRVGNRFHEWVERRATTARGTARPLFDWDVDLEDGLAEGLDAQLEAEALSELEPVEATEAAFDEGSFDDRFVDDAEALAPMIAHFEASRWAGLMPIAVEQEVSIPFAGSRLVCKLDAVYQQGEGEHARFEIVDWKAGRAPRDQAEKVSRFLQLDLYRHAYAAHTGIDADRIDVTLFYVAEGIELRGEHPRGADELERIWNER